MGKAQKEEHEGEEGGVDVASEEVHDLLPVSSLAGALARGATSGVLTVAGALSVHLRNCPLRWLDKPPTATEPDDACTTLQPTERLRTSFQITWSAATGVGITRLSRSPGLV